MVREEMNDSVQVLRIKPQATNENIQTALNKAFQGNNQNVLDSQDQEQVSETKIEETTPALLVLCSRVRIEDDLKEKIIENIQHDEEYTEVMEQLQAGISEVEQNGILFRMKRNMLVRHKREDRNEDEEFWRIVVPHDVNVKYRIMNELHSIPYAGHPGYQRTLQKVKRYFFWIGMRADVQTFVLSCPVCQIEKAEHTLVRGQLQPLQIPEEKWREVSLDFVTDLPKTHNGDNAILNVIDRATRMVHSIPCKKNIIAAQTAKIYWNNVGRLHGIPIVIYSDRGSVFTGEFWKQLWAMRGTRLQYSTAYHPQTQGLVERMNQTIAQKLCVVPYTN